MEITAGIHHFATGPFNWYVIEEGGRLTLVDAGFPGHYRTFLRGLESIGRSVKDVEAIIVTHAHADHLGFAERVRRATGAPLFVHRDDLAAVGRRLELPWFGLLSHAWHPFMASMLTRAVVDGLLLQLSITHAQGCVDGQVLDVPGHPVVLHAPGHTPGEIALHLPQRGVLLSGDVLITRDLVTGKNGAPQLAHRSLNRDTQLARRSLDRLRELGRVTMLPGHGRPWTGEMREAIELARA
ncbi:MAG: MBL fold metallo-hydrolase [Opitutae bacterium]|nr:MBL fold metallo-hydrolase [Opitutae bacterium]